MCHIALKLVKLRDILVVDADRKGIKMISRKSISWHLVKLFATGKDL